MLGQVAERGPDSAGIALYGDASLSPPGWAAVSALAPGTPGPALQAALRPLLAGAALAATEPAGVPVAVTEVADVRVAAAPVPQQQLSAAVRAVLPGAPLLGTGPDLAVLKGVGDPVRLAESFGLAGRGGYQGVGHTRMATESAVTVGALAPVRPRRRPRLVHNGSFSNYATVRRRLRAEASTSTPTTTPRSPPGLSPAGWPRGTTSRTALHAVSRSSTASSRCWCPPPTQFAVVRDSFACKPAVIAETGDYVAMASEYQALAGLPGIADAEVFEPGPRRSTYGTGEPVELRRAQPRRRDQPRAGRAARRLPRPDHRAARPAQPRGRPDQPGRIDIAGTRATSSAASARARTSWSTASSAGRSART